MKRLRAYIERRIERLSLRRCRTVASLRATAAAICELQNLLAMARYLALAALVLGATGCKGGIAARIFGPEYHGEPKRELFVVAACMDNNETGRPTFPTFLPAAHVDLIQRVKRACHDNDCQIDGNSWLAMGAGCGQGFHYIGDEYYAGRGY